MILKNYYKEAAPVGVYPISNFGGLAILDILSDESVIAAWHYGDGYENIRRHQIFYTYTGRAYIRKAGRRYYLDQIMKTNGVLQTKVNSRNEKSPANFARLKKGITKHAGEGFHRQQE